jgi:UDP-N-acetyl-D-glucosamine dehydrogenase
MLIQAPAYDLAVVGLGYVGLPLVREAVNAGLRVVGHDTVAAKVDALNNGQSYVDDLLDDELAALLAAGFQATTDPACINGAQTVVLCVPTPLREDGSPNLGAVEQAARSVASHLRPGMLVVLESTSYPGTTEDLLRPILETSGLRAGEDFHLAYSPERIDPGNLRFGLRNTPKVVGGYTEACAQAAVTFYGKLVEKVVLAKGIKEAELSKLLENTYRHVNIALVNEMAIFCDELAIDLWDAIEAAATKPFGFQAFRPGPGVGGHCIPIDPNYLSFKVRSTGYAFRFVDLAQEINSRMPAYVTARAQRLLNREVKPVNESRILLLGITYKADVADCRDTPAEPLAKRLLELGARLDFHDPFVPRWSVGERTLYRVEDLSAALRAADLVIMLQPHRSYDLEAVAELAPLLLDTSGRMSGGCVERL